MLEINCDVAIIGGGPAGLAAAIAAKKQGAGKVLIIERDNALGGILQQCIHPGFGLSYFNEELTGPEYAGRFIEQAIQHGVDIMLNSMVLEILPERIIVCANAKHGIIYIKSKSIVLAMGCRERTRGNIQIPGTRPAGVYTAGAAQRLINRQNEMVGRKVIILGSGDIGMIMARRMTLEGAKVVAVVEIMDYLSGLTRNRVQCLDDFDIPLLLSHTVTRIMGNERVEGVYISKVDEGRKPIAETEEFYECDTLLLSVGLIPENELSNAINVEISPMTNGPIVNQYMQTSIPFIFACGNVVHVNDLVDNVSVESEIAGKEAARYAMNTYSGSIGTLECRPGDNVRYICPQKIELNADESEISLYFRVSAPNENVLISLHCNNRLIKQKKALKVNPGEIEQMKVHTSELSQGSLVINVAKEAVSD